MKISFFFFFFLFSSMAYTQVKLENAESFFSDSKNLIKENINWFRVSVPENWDKSKEKKISLAIAILKAKVNQEQEPILFIQGGPGGNTIDKIEFWIDHPLRDNHDIILVDLRGTGFSEPRLCPDLGMKFFEILSKNQTKEQDVMEKILASLACKEDLIDKGIDLNSYNSIAVAKDLHAIKSLLKIRKWNVYGVSYGTLISQYYAKLYSDDILTLILDSPIPNAAEYYNENTENYVQSLDKLFEQCKNDPLCNQNFPNLENIYYNTITELEKKPITVSVDKEVIPSGLFTYNAEDYKIVIQQSLYDSKLIEVLPLLIYQFKERNEATLIGLVQAFSGALSLNYGAYYCFTCNEVLPYNDINKYEKISLNFRKLGGGLSFYRSDFDVCNAWNSEKNNKNTMVLLNNENEFRVLILSGYFDPITPSHYAIKTAANFKKHVRIITGYTYGHGLGYTYSGANVIKNFIEDKFITDSLTKDFNRRQVAFKTNILLNKGTVKMTGDFSSKQWYYFIPLSISFIIISVVFFVNLIDFFKKKINVRTVMLFLSIFLTLMFGITLILAIRDALDSNFYILAFGIPLAWKFVPLLYNLSLLFSIIAFLFSVIKILKLNIPLFIMIFLALGIIHYYFIFWDFSVFNSYLGQIVLRERIMSLF